MPYAPDGQFFAPKRSKFRCDVCARHFAEDAVPWPNNDGKRICRDCRAEAMNRARNALQLTND